MARRRKDPSLLDLIPPIGGLLGLGLFFSPAFRQVFGALFTLALGLGILVAVGLVVWFIWRLNRKQPEQPVGTSTETLPENRRVAFERAERTDRPVCHQPAWSRDLLSQLEWKRFEDVVAAYSRELGYEARTTRIGADGGVDVQLFQDGQAQPVMIIQCKAWDAYKVGVKPVRELFGVMAADKVANGAFFTTGEFTTEAEEWAREKNLDLVNGREFLSRIGELPAATQQKLLRIATEGDYTTPTCPSCGVKMVQRTASKGRNEGSNFWGCRNYPRCKQTFNFTDRT